MEAEERIIELETELKRRDEKIKELSTERDEAQGLVDRQREAVEGANLLIERWIEAFDMHQSDDGRFLVNEVWADLLEGYNGLFEDHSKLIRDWNKFVGHYNAVVRPRERGRPLAASAVQQADVLKRRKSGQTLRAIAAATRLGLRTVCTITDKTKQRDRTSKRTNLLRRQEFDRRRAAAWRAKKRMRESLPQQIAEQLKTGAALAKAAKGIGR
jgi:hypothetical protein